MAILVHYLLIAALGIIFSFGISYLCNGGTRWRSRVFSSIGSSISVNPSSTLSPTLRSLSPEKPAAEAAFSQTLAEYLNILPPSSREGLLQAAKLLPRPLVEIIESTDVNELEAGKSLIPFDADYRNCNPSTFTPTQIKVGEVKALGDFPDYARLSGVPLPEAYSNFNIETALPRPYRPFRWAYHQTMSLTKMEKNWWLELEKGYVRNVAHRVKLFEKHGKLVLDYLPGSELAAKEIMEMALQFYCARYPDLFSIRKYPRLGYVLRNRLLNDSTVIADYHPLHVLLRNVPEDFAIMLRNPDDGYYYLRGGVICSSLGWSLNTKLGLRLNEIHAPIPDYKEKMQFSMDRYFSRLPASRPIQRGSWGLEVDTPLFMPPGDPHETNRDSQSPDLLLSRCHLRVDWQTLRRLPLSGAIVFNFKALFSPVVEFQDESYIPGLLKKILREGKSNMMEYKNTWHVEHVVLPALDEWERDQIDKGLVKKDWEVSTLEESPMFPGWQKKWHRQQGF